MYVVEYVVVRSSSKLLCYLLSIPIVIKLLQGVDPAGKSMNVFSNLNSLCLYALRRNARDKTATTTL